jgi:NADPH-dependent glutamate synthase beta subunit-like oxidoreductase/ferredoxin
MIHLKIDNIVIQAEEGITVLEAAGMAGIPIPSMCHLNGFGNHPSCMVCVVRDNKTKAIVPSCAMMVANGMDITASDDEVKAARRQALELLLSDHVGDCEAPCSLGCPAGMNIPLMNRLIGEGRFTEALTVVKEDIALPYVLGYICPAPCEKACRRKQADEAVSICTLKRFTAASGIDLAAESVSKKKEDKEFLSGKKVAVIGSGPAGLASAYYLLRFGHSCDIFEKSSLPGGTLRYVLSEETLPKDIIDHEINILWSMGVNILCNTLITPEYFNTRIRGTYDAIILATGDIKSETYLMEVAAVNKTGFEVNEKDMSTSVPGIFVCGSAVRPHKMAVRSGAQGKTAAIAVHHYLNGKSYEKPGKMFNSRFDRLLPEEIEEYLKDSVRTSRVETTADLKSGFTPAEATREALRCMHCDCRKKDNCLLRIHSDAYRIDRKKFMTGDRKIMTKQVQHDFLVYEPEKCIKCGLCVDISNHEGEKFGLAFEGRGFDVVITPSLGSGFNESLSHSAVKCAGACPTGALSMKE